MNKKRCFHLIVYVGFFSLLMSGCTNTRYQSFMEEESGKLIQFRQHWEAPLPYKSGQDLVIENASGNELMLSEAQDGFHLVRMQLAGDGKPEDTKHFLLEHGENCEILDNGLILVSGKRNDKTRSVALVDQKNLSRKFSYELPFSEETDFTIPGSRQVDDFIVLYQSAVEIDKYTWSDASYRYTVPYVSNSKYDMHVVNLTNGESVSFPGLDSQAMTGLGELVALSKKEAVSKTGSNSVIPGSKRSTVNQYIYLLDQFFIVNKGTVLVFSLASLEGNMKLYYTLNLKEKGQTPELRSAAELSAAYPDELVASNRSSKNKDEQRQLTISGKKYRVERTAFLPSGLVVIAKETSDTSLLDGVNSNPKVIMGARLVGGSETGSLERVWEYRPKYEGTIVTLLTDSRGGAIYFPDSTESKSMFKVQGLNAADGKPVEGFPANFKENTKERQLRIVGTAVDFQKNLLYIHDYEKNRIVCADLR